LPQRPTARAVSSNGDCTTRFTDFVASGYEQKGVWKRLFAELGKTLIPHTSSAIPPFRGYTNMYA
jgi:hypothetical protein